jgi:pseudouridine synthase
MLLTDDGDLAHRLSHPRFEHAKTYYVLVEQRPAEAVLAQFRQGVDLPEGRTAPARIRVVQRLPPELHLSAGPSAGVWLEVKLHEGKKRQIRHMTAALGHPTLRLVRWAIGPLTLGSLKLGEVRPLTRDEVNALRQSVVAEAVELPNAHKQAEAGQIRRGVRPRGAGRRPFAR